MKARILLIQLPTHGRGVASAGGYRDGAPTQYESGSHIPLIVRCPGKVKPGSQ